MGSQSDIHYPFRYIFNYLEISVIKLEISFMRFRDIYTQPQSEVSLGQVVIFILYWRYLELHLRYLWFEWDIFLIVFEDIIDTIRSIFNCI